MSEQYLEKLIKKVSKLPGLGPRSSRRVVLHLLKDKEKLLLPLIEDLNTVANNIRSCVECGNLDENEICQICKDSSRNQNLLCVVETVADLWALERSNVYNGKYHILGGVLSAIDGVNPEQLNIASLEKRLENESITEIIIAISAEIAIIISVIDSFSNLFSKEAILSCSGLTPSIADKTPPNI